MVKKYSKVVVTNNMFAVAAVYEHHPFRPSAIKDAVESSGHKCGDIDTGVDDSAWCWVYYDWCGNPVGLSDEQPEGIIVDKFTADNLGGKSFQNLADYLNIESAV